MEKFTTHTGVAAPLQYSDVDTDQIIPAEFLKRVSRTGFQDGLFATWREDDGFLLNQPAYRNATVLVAGRDFGIGSSREHAVWALKDFGFRAVLSSRFGDIFRGNAGKQGLLTAVVAQAEIERLWEVLAADPGREVTVDLVARMVTCGGYETSFDVDDYTRWRLIEGHDDISLTLRHVGAIEQFEAARAAHKPTTQALAGA